jgi:hypothetical protein
MQVIFTDAKGKRHVLNARDAAAVAHMVTAKHAEGWVLSPENPPVVHAAASDVAFAASGEFLDPKGLVSRLNATTPDAFRVLVTRKLAAGWRRIEKSPRVAPMANETQVALPPTAPEAAPAPAAPVVTVSEDERNAAIAEAKSKADK